MLKKIVQATDKNSEKKETQSPLEFVSLSERQRNPELGQLFAPTTQLQFIRQIQTNWRNKHGKTYNGNAREALTTTVDSTIDFIPKPTSELAKQKIKFIAACVREARLQDLPFSDPDFLIYLNEALRLGEIKSHEQIVAPTLLYSDTIEYRYRNFATIRKHTIGEPNEPYPITRMSCFRLSDMPIFQQELSQIPESERCYYSVNLSHKQEIAYLWECISFYQRTRKIRYMHFLKKYLDRFKLTAEEKEKLVFFKEIKQDNITFFSKDAAMSLLKFIISKESIETIRFCRLQNTTDASPFNTENDKVTLSSHNNPLLISFLLETYQRSSAKFDTCVVNLNLGEDERLFKEYISANEDEKASELLCKHWKSKIILDGKYSQQYEQFYAKKQYAFAAHALWRATLSGKQIALCSMLHDEDSDRLPAENKIKLKTELKAYVTGISDTAEQQKLEQWICALDNTTRQKTREAAREIQKMIESHMSPLTAHFWEWSVLCYLDWGAINIISNSLAGGDEAPWLAISPDYNPDDTTTPLLCSITYTQSAYRALLNAIFGVQAIGAEFSYGALKLIDYITLGENPSLLGRVKYHKPVELYYPTIRPTCDIHGAETHVGQAIRHDLLSHNLINSEEPFQEMLHYLKRFLTFQKNFPLSKPIYKLVDLGTSVGGAITQARKDKKKNDHYERYWIYLILSLAGRSTADGDHNLFWAALDTHDDNLIFIVDMILHRKIWFTQLRRDPVIALEKLHARDSSIAPHVPNFKAVLATLQKIVDSEKINQQPIYYILAYRLRNHPARKSLCKQLQKINLKDILQWERNSGLYFYKDFGFQNREIEKLDAKDLHDQLQRISRVVAPHATNIPHFSEHQGAIFCILVYRFKDHPHFSLWCDILKNTDLTKILRFRSKDRKLYFVDPNTNDREPNLLTETDLAVHDKQFYVQFTAWFRDAYNTTPHLFEYLTLTADARKLLGLPKVETAETKDFQTETRSSGLKNILQAIKDNNIEKLNSLLAKLNIKLPAFMIETALENADAKIISALLHSKHISVNLRTLKILTERLQTNKVISAERVPEIIFQLMKFSKTPDEREALMLRELFHPEFLLDAKAFFKILLEKAPTSDILNKKSALGWWFYDAIRDCILHENPAEILNLVKHSEFPAKECSSHIRQALFDRGAARIPLAAKLSFDEIREIEEVLDLARNKIPATKLKEFEEDDTKNQELQQKPAAFQPSPQLIQAIKDEIIRFRRGSSLFTIGMTKKAVRIQNALDRAMGNLKSIDSQDDFLDFKARDDLMSIREALQSFRKIKPFCGQTDAIRNVQRKLRL